MSPGAFQEFLRAEFARRAQRNPKYSLRAFARAIGVDPSHLSKLNAGKRALTWQTAARIAQTMGSDLVEFADDGPTPEPELAIVEGDRVAMMADWVHFAVMELLAYADCPTSDLEIKRWAAGRLGASTARIDGAWRRLKRLGMIKRQVGGRYQVEHQHTTTLVDPKKTSDALRTYQRVLLEKAADALEDRPIEERDHTGLMLSVRRNDLPSVKAALTRFRRRFLAQFEAAQPDADCEVYQLSLALFPLTIKSRHHST